MNTQPEALRLADKLDDYSEGPDNVKMTAKAASELRRLHEVNQMLVEAAEIVLKALDYEPESFVSWTNKLREARETLRQALAKAKEQT